MLRKGFVRGGECSFAELLLGLVSFDRVFNEDGGGQRSGGMSSGDAGFATTVPDLHRIALQPSPFHQCLLSRFCLPSRCEAEMLTGAVRRGSVEVRAGC